MASRHFQHPSAYRSMLGGHFIDAVMSTERPALRIGGDVWSRHDVATRLGVTHTTACGILSAICRKLGVINTADLYDKTSPYILADTRMGVTTMYVMFAAFQDKGFSVKDWYKLGEEKALVTFTALKLREQKAEKRTRDDQKKRNRRRGRQEHEKQVHETLTASA